MVITSATLDGEKLSAYFGECPVLTVPGRVFDVQVIHSKDNHEGDIMNAAVDTALQIHLDEPAGDILVFLTGQAEIDKAYHFMLSSHLCDVGHLLFLVDCLAQIHDWKSNFAIEDKLQPFAMELVAQLFAFAKQNPQSRKFASLNHS